MNGIAVKDDEQSAATATAVIMIESFVNGVTTPVGETTMHSTQTVSEYPV